MMEKPDRPEDVGVLRRRVNRGARWLDGQIPEWFNTVDLTKLNLESECACILGQLAWDYNKTSYRNCISVFIADSALDVVRGPVVLSGPEACYYGFAFDDFADQWVDFLEAEWVVQIEKRRAEAGTM
jgi:hypothetical protein